MEGAEETDKSDDSECEDLRQKILERLTDGESSEGSDREEESYQIRLSCILEDDETDGSPGGTFSARDAKQPIPKNDETVRKSNERDKREETKPELSEYIPKQDSAEELLITNGDRVQVTDLDDISFKNMERTEEPINRDDETDGLSTAVETKGTSERPHSPVSIPNDEVEGDGKPERNFRSKESPDLRRAEQRNGEIGDIFRDVHIRGVLQKEYNPPVPPETYLWEEIKRSREKGGYPWTYLDEPEKETRAKSQEHEYEPVDPPPHPSSTKEDDDKEMSETEKRFVRIPLDAELVVKEEDYEEDVGAAEETKSPEDSEVERIARDGDVGPDRSESRYLAATPTTTASQSRTDCDVNTSMLDSSGLEDLPLNRGSRNKKAIQSKSEQMRAQAHGIHQKLRSQAGKLRNKLRSLPKPSFNLKEKSKTEPQPEKSKTRSPRFGLPERPKFKLPERPKINLPSFGKSKTGRDRQSAVPPVSSGFRKNIFDIDFKTYPRIFSKKSRERGDYATSSPKQTRGNTPPPVMRYREPDISPDKKPAVGQKWIDEIKYADADADDPGEYESRRSEKSESLSDFRDKDLGCAEDLETMTRLPPGRRTLSTKSSLSHLSEREIQSSGSSEDRLRKGVLEEIDSDQFFLRQKGISQEDIDMGKYLSREIREAFKSPVANALARMDYDYDDDAESENLEPKSRKPDKEPSRPTRTRSLKKRSGGGKISGSDPGLNDQDYYKTYPPRRPSRRSRSRSKGAAEDGKPKPRYENENSSYADKYESVGAEEDDLSEYYKSPGSIKEYEHYKVPRSDAPSVRPVPTKRKSSSKDRISSKKKNEGWVEVEIETSVEEIERAPPRPLTRRKSQKQRSTEERGGNIGQEEITAEPDYIVPADPNENSEGGPPVPPKRTRSMSRGSRSLRSLKLQDDEKESGAPVGNRSETEAETGAVERRELSGDEASLGYATVGKSTLARPERHKKQKPQRPPPPRKKRDLSSPSFNTLPKRVPVRPARNYSTLGPSRPPRRRGVGSVEHLYAGDTQSQSYVEITDDGDALKLWRSQDLHGSTKDLQTEEVIEKMKGRPLPPPPRPPRQKSRGPEEKSEESDYPIVTRVEVAVHEPPPGTEIVEEVCVSTQTDPLPEDSCLETDEDFEAMQEFSHEQLRIQEAFLQEMKEEEERIRQETAVRRRSQIDLENAVISKDNEVIKRLEEIVAEERKLFAERQKTEFTQAEEKRLAAQRLEKEKEEKLIRERGEEAVAVSAAAAAEEKKQAEEIRLLQEEKKAREEKKKQEEAETMMELDMGYASLDRRQLRPENEPASIPLPQPASLPVSVPLYVPVMPDSNSTVQVLKAEKLEIKLLEVERLNVNELEANRIRAEDLQTARLTSEDVTTRGGNLTVGNLELPPDFVRQILTSIPWDEIGFFRERSGSFPRAPTPTSTPVESALPNFPTTNLSVPRTRSPRRRRQGPSEGESQEEDPFPSSSSFRRIHKRRHGSKQPFKYSSGEEEDGDERREIGLRRHFSRSGSQNQNQSVFELSRQLARACASAGVRTARNMVSTIRTDLENVRSEDKALYVQAVLCIAIVLVAGFFLLGFDSKAIYHYHWDFQFPPRPPPHSQGD